MVSAAVVNVVVVLMYAILLRLFHFLPRWMTSFRMNNGKIHYSFYKQYPLYQPKVQLEHELPPNHKQLPGVQSTKVVHILVQIEQRQQLLQFQNSELFICMRWHQIVRLFLAICQEPVHSESEAMPKHLLARSTWFRKTTLFLVENTLLLVMQHITL